MNYSLYINGVYEDVLEEIRKAQSSEPGLICYLQPYASDTIVRLAESPPTESDPVKLYISLTSSLPFVSYRAEIIGWENKEEIDPARLARLNDHIKRYQPGESEIYMVGGNNKPSINLISVRNMERLETPIHVSNFIKLSNSKPLKPRTTSGGWSYVKALPQWLGTIPVMAIEDELYQDLEKQVSTALESTKEARAQRLQSAPKLPELIQVVSKGFKRNADVIAEVLLRANGHCENCGKEAPFKRAKDGTSYLEVHHKIMLSQGGEDTVENAIATCQNCHRELHFGV
jgi:5-methylcytosine-specific restriction endonuclease McrA